MSRTAVGNRWHAVLHDRLRGRATPLLVTPDTLWSAASLWAGTRRWIAAFRAAEVGAGDCVVCALPAGPGFVQVLLASLWEGVMFAPVDPATDVAAACREVGATLCVALQPPPEIECPLWRPDASWQPPPDAGPFSREATLWLSCDPHDTPALLIRTSGSSGRPKWIGLSTDNIFAVLDSHREAQALQGAIVLCVLPWHHVFGLVLGLLAALRDAEEVIVAQSLVRSDDALAALVAQHPVTHVDLVPALAERWRNVVGLQALVSGASGIVGGAPVTPTLCTSLCGSQFRVGYGQTEAAPGIMLGDRGAFNANGIGRPVGARSGWALTANCSSVGRTPVMGS